MHHSSLRVDTQITLYTDIHLVWNAIDIAQGRALKIIINIIIIIFFCLSLSCVLGIGKLLQVRNWVIRMNEPSHCDLTDREVEASQERGAVLVRFTPSL